MMHFRAEPLGFRRRRTPLGPLWEREGLDPQEVDAILEGFSRGGAPAEALKEDVKTSVYRGPRIDGRGIVLKVYRSPRRGRRAFRNHCALWRGEVPVPEPFFFLERSRTAGGGAVLGMEDLAPLPELDRWLSENLDRREAPPRHGPDLREISRRLGALLRDLHGRGIDFGDLKTCNIFIREEPLRFLFVDFDGARIGSVPKPRARADALVQLNRSTPVSLGLECRRDFWKEYGRDLPGALTRSIRRSVLRKSGERPVVYVSRRGLREEPWPGSAGGWPRRCRARE